MKLSLAIFAVSAFSLIGSLTSAHSAVVGGSLDPLFGAGGKVTTDVNGRSDACSSAVLQKDGKIVVAGASSLSMYVDVSIMLARYETNGALDSSFGIGGKSSVHLQEGYLEYAEDLVIQPDGRIVVVGFAYGPYFGNQPILLARFTSTGLLDTSFNGTGFVSTMVNGVGAIASAIALQSDGKILIAGNTPNYLMFVSRYNVDGSLDTTFGQSGSATASFPGTSQALGLAIQADGKIVLTGQATGVGFAAARFLPDGTLDPAFNGTGLVTTIILSSRDVATAVAIQADGKILLGGYTYVDSCQFAAVRYNPDGSLDPTFDGDGKTTFFINGTYDMARDIKVRPDGKIAMAGISTSGEVDVFSVACLNPNGSLDTSFNGTGSAVTAFGLLGDYAQKILWQNDGKLTVAGLTVTNIDENTQTYFLDIALARFIGPAEIAVQQPEGTDLQDGVSVVQFSGTIRPVMDGSHQTNAGVTGDTLTFTLKNTGSGDLNSLSTKISGINAADFKIIGSKLVTLAGGSSYQFSVRFSPRSTGRATAMLRIKSNDSDESSFDITLNGTTRAR